MLYTTCSVILIQTCFWFLSVDTKIYDSGHIKVTVTTSEVSREEEEIDPIDKPQIATDKKHNLPITKKKLFKKVVKQKSRPKPRSKRDKRKGKIKK